MMGGTPIPSQGWMKLLTCTTMSFIVFCVRRIATTSKTAERRWRRRCRLSPPLLPHGFRWRTRRAGCRCCPATSCIAPGCQEHPEMGGSESQRINRLAIHRDRSPTEWNLRMQRDGRNIHRICQDGGDENPIPHATLREETHLETVMKNPPPHSRRTSITGSIQDSCIPRRLRMRATKFP